MLIMIEDPKTKSNLKREYQFIGIDHYNWIATNTTNNILGRMIEIDEYNLTPALLCGIFFNARCTLAHVCLISFLT